MKTVCSKIDSLFGEQREHKKILHDHDQRLDTLEQQIVELQDRSRRNNLRLIGLPEGTEKDDPVGFLRHSLPVWFPSLADKEIEIERAHRIYSNFQAKANSTKRPRVLIFKLLRYNDRDVILRKARINGPVRRKME